MNQTELGLRLRRARENCGISQQIAADTIGAPRTAITQIEAGNRIVSSLELEKLARLYARPLTWFLDDEPQDDDLVVVLHRVAGNMANDPEINRQVTHCIELCREGMFLETMLGRSVQASLPRLDVPLPRNAGEAITQGEALAERERKRLDLGLQPLDELDELLAQQGIWASSMPLHADISGLFLHHPSIGLAIIINADHASVRQHFSFAHEYAHALLDRHATVTVSSRGNSHELIEKRANAFAAAFLMPAQGVDEQLQRLGKRGGSRQERMVYDVATDGRSGAELRAPPHAHQLTYQDIAVIARYFDVSYQAAVYRLNSLGHMSARERDTLLNCVEQGRTYTKNVLRQADPDQPKQASSRTLLNEIAYLAIEAYRREEISRGRLLELSSLIGITPTSILLDLADAACAD
jgi:Zn-dependent peptidase ImmA (M78 family)/transcriptional regulator with XRE-family HTH domain